MWKFKDEAEGLTKTENIQKVKSMLEALPQKIDFIREMHVEVNVNPKEGMFDAMLISAFDSIDDVESHARLRTTRELQFSTSTSSQACRKAKQHSRQSNTASRQKLSTRNTRSGSPLVPPSGTGQAVL